MYVGRTGVCRDWWGKLKKVDHLEYIGVVGRILLKWIFKI
jgi:hypothetical protein